MPYAPARPCRAYARGCPATTTAKDGLCDAHRAEKRAQLDAMPHRRAGHAWYKSQAWLRLRARVLKEEPVCRECGDRLATHVDHIRPRRDFPELALDRSNLQGLCEQCHNRKSGREAFR